MKIQWLVCIIVLNCIYMSHGDVLIRGKNDNEIKSGFVSIFKRFPQEVEPDIHIMKNEDTLKGWKREWVFSKILFWAPLKVENITWRINDFVHPSGSIITSDSCHINPIGYVVADEFGPGCGYRKNGDFPTSLREDYVINDNSFLLEERKIQPLWVKVHIPEHALEGVYRGEIIFFLHGNEMERFSLNINVVPKTLPLVKNWGFYLDLWQNPFAVARYHRVELWSEAHWELLKKTMKPLAEGGQKVVTATLNDRPWGGQTYDEYKSMIKWTKKKDGNWSYDYDVFDRWVMMMDSLGINKAINCYSVLPWKNQVSFFDETKNSKVVLEAKPGGDEFINVWKPFLEDFKGHLIEEKWFYKTNLAMDERSPEEMDAALSLIASVSKGFKIALADNHKSYQRYPGIVRDLCVSYGALPERKDMLERKRKNFITTYYVCCSHSFPNVFSFSPFYEAVYIPWYSKIQGFDGFLRWAYNSWVENPLEDSRFRAWPSGDTYLVYPNGCPSLRLELLKKGIQDFEKIKIIEKEGAKTKKNEVKEILSALKEMEEGEELEKKLIEAEKILNDF